MGQCISVHIRSDRARKYQLQSLLLQQPTDILDLIFEVLEPDNTVLLSLTCKGLYLRYFEQALTDLRSASQEQNHTFQLLWERDIGHRQYYCPACRYFQKFQSHWTAGQNRYHGIHWSYKKPRDLCYTPSFNPSIRGYKLEYCLGRLVMNRHLLGTPRGLRLDCLETEFTVKPSLYYKEKFVWTQSWKAKIIHDTLFLCATHVADQESLKISGQEFRDAVDTFFYCICEHVHVSRRSSRQLRELEAPRGPSGGALFIPCQDAEGACKSCLTDYKTTIKWCAEQGMLPESRSGVQRNSENGNWNITMTAYHRLGRFRSVDDREWQSATGKFPRMSVRRMDSAQQRALGLQRCAPGLVMKSWEEC